MTPHLIRIWEVTVAWVTLDVGQPEKWTQRFLFADTLSELPRFS
jgi:hypothetical protein